MNIRVMGPADAVAEAVERIENAFTVPAVSDPYPCRGRDCDRGWVRVYVEVREP